LLALMALEALEASRPDGKIGEWLAGVAVAGLGLGPTIAIGLLVLVGCILAAAGVRLEQVLRVGYLAGELAWRGTRGAVAVGLAARTRILGWRAQRQMEKAALRNFGEPSAPPTPRI